MGGHEHGPIYRVGFGPRSRPMGGHGHNPFKAGTKWPIERKEKAHIFIKTTLHSTHSCTLKITQSQR
jgi:hypothetical protein